MSTIFDPRQFVKDLLQHISVPLDDNVTPAQIISLYEGGPENARHLLFVNNYHAVITVGRHQERESGDGKRILGKPIRYDADVPVYVSAINKAGSTAAVLLNKIRLALIGAVESVALDDDADFRVTSSEEQNQTIGGYTPMWIDKYILHVRPLTGTGFSSGVYPISGGGGGGGGGVFYYGFEIISAAQCFESGFERVLI